MAKSGFDLSSLFLTKPYNLSWHRPWRPFYQNYSLNYQSHLFWSIPTATPLQTIPVIIPRFWSIPAEMPSQTIPVRIPPIFCDAGVDSVGATLIRTTIHISSSYFVCVFVSGATLDTERRTGGRHPPPPLHNTFVNKCSWRY